jgi:hypothetical protein
VALARRHGTALAPRIAAALLTLHVAYGVGFWRGLAAFGVPRPGRPMEAAIRESVRRAAGR